MADTAQHQNERFDSSAGHLSVRIDGRPELQFQFAVQPRRLGLAFLASFGVQAAVLALVIFAGRLGLQKVGILPPQQLPDMVFIPQQGPGGGGGGGGNQMKEPPKKAEIPKEKPVTVAPEPPKVEPDVIPQFNIPVTTLAKMELPGAFAAPAGLPTASQGSGPGGGGGTGRGTGVGNGTGSGIGDGSGGGIGGGTYHPGTGGSDPIPIVRAEPQYTTEAMRAHVTGEVWVECTVMPTGQPADCHVVRSLDAKYGLDQEAIRTAMRWKFKPGTNKQGVPVAFIISIAVEFNLR